MEIKHILVPFDDSDRSFNAFNFALDLAKKYHSNLSVVTVMYSSVLGSSFLDLPSHETYIEKTRLKRLSHVFNRLKLAADKFQIPFISEIILSSSVAESLLSFANSYKVDLIVLGTRGRTGSTLRLQLGSVATLISHNATCPVLLVK